MISENFDSLLRLASFDEADSRLGLLRLCGQLIESTMPDSTVVHIFLLLI